MTVPPILKTQVTHPGRANPENAKATDKQAEHRPGGALSNPRDEIKARTNKGLIEAMFGAADKSNDKAMRIFYREVLDKLNTELGEAFAATEDRLASKADDFWSPENTAERIANGALGHFDTFKKQHPSLSETEQVEQFLVKIGGAIDEGFGEALKVLDGLGVYAGSIKDNADSTRALVDERLAAFREARLNPQQ
ncbi:hypothetical protein C7H85_01055 [Zobellella endophytica]|uniref:DUF5610 domain-containing protein n=1 Tax=Zobellella endophytica TaxID=2116700 RepID=A0A2P7RB40_9GAMM|nr:DUF5610 domain-containing protein [Zobellella endophytica]PSJ47454.1 hypothetical protein C7H85_01055 [Zobellella endophytica]